MKKLLMVTTAIAGVAMLSAPASAAIDMNVDGYFRGYVLDVDNESNNLNDTDFRRASELHIGGETTLDSGLTVGVMTEFNVDENNGTANGFVDTDEIYAYASGGWGRVNLGKEDGAAYLLQVAAPSADSNVDGFSITIEGVEEATNSGVFTGIGFESTLDYDQNDMADAERITYMTPKFNGFQAGVSYAFDNTREGNVSVMSADNTADEAKDIVDVAARYDGEYQGFAFSVGAGYSTYDLEARGTIEDFELTAGADDAVEGTRSEGVDTYNVGANVMFQNFSLGAVYVESATEYLADTDTAAGTTTLVSGDVTQKTYVIGAAYDNGPYHVGASYYNRTNEKDMVAFSTGLEEETNKYTIGGGYSFGPGITFRGSVSWGDMDETTTAASNAAVDGAELYTAADKDFTQIAVGTDIKF